MKLIIELKDETYKFFKEKLPVIIARSGGKTLTSDVYEAIKNGKPYDEADKWISVKERLPEPRTTVMVYCPERKTQYCAFYADKHWQIFGSYDTVWGEVTHWRPLPKAPESEAENED